MTFTRPTNHKITEIDGKKITLYDFSLSILFFFWIWSKHEGKHLRWWVMPISCWKKGKLFFMSLFPSVLKLTVSNYSSMLSCCLDTEDLPYLTDLQKWNRKKVEPKSINTDNSQQMTLSVKWINSLSIRGWSQTDTVCCVEACGRQWKIKQFLTSICRAHQSPTRYNRHPLLNLPAKAICLHKRPASKAMLVWLLNYWNCNSIIFYWHAPTSTHRVWNPTVPVDGV